MSKTVWVRYGGGDLTEIPAELGDVLRALQSQRLLVLAALREQMSKCWCLPPASRCSMCQRHAALITQIES